MNAWIVYDKDNVDRNTFFIDRWMEASKRRGIGLDLVLSQDIAWGVQDDQLMLQHKGAPARPDFVVMRAQHPLLSRHLEAMGIPCYNNSRVADICNDKRQTHSLFQGRLPMMDTAYVDQAAFARPFPYPVVVKAAHGCGGREVFLAEDEQAYHNALKAIAPDSAVVQPLCDEPGRDLRVYVLGDQIVATMMRYSDGDFRSNFGLGGNSKPMPLDAAERRMVDIVMQEFTFGLVGIDFIRQGGRWVFNEIEDAVGTRMLYMHTGRDIASDYLDLILSRL